MDYSYNPDLAVNPFWFSLALAVLGTFALVAYAINSWILSRVFLKLGISPAKAWVPFYNNWLLLESAQIPGPLALLPAAAIIPFIGPMVAMAAIVPMAIAAYRLSPRFGKEAALYTVIYVLIPILWLGIIAFDKSTYLPERVTTATPAE
jgi:hypothetical protein